LDYKKIDIKCDNQSAINMTNMQFGNIFSKPFSEDQFDFRRTLGLIIMRELRGEKFLLLLMCDDIA